MTAPGIFRMLRSFMIEIRESWLKSSGRSEYPATEASSSGHSDLPAVHVSPSQARGLLDAVHHRSGRHRPEPGGSSLLPCRRVADGVVREGGMPPCRSRGWEPLVEAIKSLKLQAMNERARGFPSLSELENKQVRFSSTERTVCSESLKNNGRLRPDPEGYQQSGIEQGSAGHAMEEPDT